VKVKTGMENAAYMQFTEITRYDQYLEIDLELVPVLILKSENFTRQ